jgi:putative endonuclease
MYCVYILQSVDHDKFYIGVSKNIDVRLKKHNNGSSKSTKPYRPWRIIYTEKFENKGGAYKREFYLKQPRGYQEKRKIIEQNKLDKKYGGIA